MHSVLICTILRVSSVIHITYVQAFFTNFTPLHAPTHHAVHPVALLTLHGWRENRMTCGDAVYQQIQFQLIVSR